MIINVIVFLFMSYLPRAVSKLVLETFLLSKKLHFYCLKMLGVRRMA